jgi:hypothetical protein
VNYLGEDGNAYRFYFTHRTREKYDDFSELIDLAKFFTQKTGDIYNKGVFEKCNMEEMKRVLISDPLSKKGLEILEKAKKEKKWKPVSEAPRAKLVQLMKIYADEPIVKQTLELYELFRDIEKLENRN